MNAVHVATLTLVVALAAALGPACGGSGGGGGGGGGSGGDAGTTTTKPLPKSICLLQNCEKDLDCEACADGKTTCLVAERRCVACDPGSPDAGAGGGQSGPSGCPAGLLCSPYGACTPESVTCPTDNGIPAITCDTNADCAACDPAHQVCEPLAHKCVACTTSDTSHCQSTEICEGGDCVPECPATCTTDADCAQCGAAGNEAHFCTEHRCSTCSATGASCGTGTCGDHGTCTAPCGSAGGPRGRCSSDADCSTCGGGATTCNGVESGGGKGICGSKAPGCDDIGSGAPVLPAPFDVAVRPCFEDGDCAGAGAEIDVGAMLRDLTGWPQIHDAKITYPLAVCGTLTVTEADEGCGLCVPCRADTDCQALDVDAFADQAFGPLGAVGEAYLLDQIFGSSPRRIYLYCQPLGGDYGVCAPCPGLLNDCRLGNPPGDTGTPCHDECATGNAMGSQCGACVIEVCKADPFCCTTEWDEACAGEVGNHCKKACEDCAKPDQGGHDKCDPTATAPLAETCSPCVAAVCQTRPECCTTAWDQACIDLVPQYCKEGYLCAGQCNDPAQCAPLGCLATYKCGGCVHDYDCTAGQLCDPASGDCW